VKFRHKVRSKGVSKLNYKIGDIVRFKDREKKGLHEITGTYEDQVYQYSVTNDECDSEFYARSNQLVFVCSIDDRKDLD
jgi:hypothetical protein